MQQQQSRWALILVRLVVAGRQLAPQLVVAGRLLVPRLVELLPRRKLSSRSWKQSGKLRRLDIAFHCHLLLLNIDVK